MTGKRLEKLLADIRPVRIGVLGDFCLDAYWTLDVSLSEISIETGLATRPVSSQRYSLGGAGNVVSNLVAMGVTRVSAFGVLGSDPFGREVLRLLLELSVDTRGILSQEIGWDTPVYLKPVEGESEQARKDFGSANRLDPGKGMALLRTLREALSALDLVVVNQQLLHGIHTEEFRGELVSLMRGSKIPFICDSRSFSDSYAGAMRKLNDREALRLCAAESAEYRGAVPGGFSDLDAAAETLFDRWKQPVFLTRGSRGMLVRDERGTWEVPGLQILGRVDPVGAGDSALAGIAAAMAAGRDAREAATLGNFVAGVTVQKLSVTGTASPGEILAIGTDPDYVHNPELADNPRSARFHGDSEIEIVTGLRNPSSTTARYSADSALPGLARVTHAIFDNDGTLSTLREGWENIMEPVMIRAILGDGWKTAKEKLFRNVQDRVRQYIDMTTGVQTLVQMRGLVEMVREFGVVPAAEVKDARGYKALYNGELLAVVRRRVAKLERGELCVEDCMLKGALPMLQALHASGVKLYLVSGTDEEDVVAEAKSLGLASLFEGRIHGAKSAGYVGEGGLDIEAKKLVLEKVLAEMGAENAGTLVTFGDGPVEMRETRRRGGCAVGVASDELRRFGWNVRKRSRLIRAGADIVVPDFSQWKTLLGFLGVRA